MRFIVLVLVIMTCPCFSQDFTIEKSAFGTIVINGKYAGSAFVAGTDKTVITCSHVIENYKEIYYQDMDKGVVHPLKLIYNDTLHDFAILASENIITKEPLKIMNPGLQHLGKKILYLGYDQRKSDSNNRSFTYAEADIISLGSTFSAYRGGAVDFMDYEGVGIGGFSGGPVFDINTQKVIGIITESYSIIGSKNNIRNFNRAFSIAPVVKLFEGR